MSTAADVLIGRQWPLGAGNPRFGLSLLYGTAGLPASHQERGLPLVRPGMAGVGVLLAPALSVVEVGCDGDSQLFTNVRSATRVMGGTTRNIFDQPIGSTMFIPVPVEFTALTLPRGDIYDHPGAFTPWAPYSSLHEVQEFARGVPTVAWNFAEGVAHGPGQFSARLASDPTDAGFAVLAKAEAVLTWAWTVWPLSSHEFDALTDATSTVEYESVWGECGCYHDMDYAEVVDSYLDAHPAVRAEAEADATYDGDVYDWVMTNDESECMTWWLTEAHADPWEITAKMFDCDAGREVLPLIAALRASTETVTQCVRDMLRKGDQSWSCSWEEQYLWPAH